jgi:Co/Zn/Cd efflux system component
MDCCNHSHASDTMRGNPGYRRALWVVLGINAVMFLAEIGAGLAAGSASLQADALDFLGDAANYGISLLVVGMTLRYRALAAFAKGLSMAVFGLWVIGTVVWHAAHGTLPSAMTMGAVGAAALIANALSFAILWVYRTGDATMRSAWICTRNDVLGNLAVLLAAAGVFGTGTGWPTSLLQRRWQRSPYRAHRRCCGSRWASCVSPHNDLTDRYRAVLILDFAKRVPRRHW